MKENGNKTIFFPFLLSKTLYRNTWFIAKLGHVKLRDGKGSGGKGGHNLVTRDNIDFGRGACYGSGQQCALAPDSCVQFDECCLVLNGMRRSYVSWK